MRVGMIQRGGDVQDQSGRLVERESPRGEGIGQRDSFDKLADDVRKVGAPAHLVYRHDPGVMQLGRVARFAHKAVFVLAESESAATRNLDGDVASDSVSRAR